MKWQTVSPHRVSNLFTPRLRDYSVALVELLLVDHREQKWTIMKSGNLSNIHFNVHCCH